MNITQVIYCDDEPTQLVMSTGAIHGVRVPDADTFDGWSAKQRGEWSNAWASISKNPPHSYLRSADGLASIVGTQADLLS